MDIYNEGVTALKSKNYEKSYRVFTYLKDYKDSIEKTIASVVGTDNYKKAIDLCKNKWKSIRTVCQNNGLADKYTLLVKNFTKFTGTFEKTYRGKIYVKFDEKNMCLVLEHINGNTDVKRVIDYASVIGHSSFHDEDNIYEVYENYIIYLNNEKFVKIA